MGALEAPVVLVLTIFDLLCFAGQNVTALAIHNNPPQPINNSCSIYAVNTRNRTGSYVSNSV